MGDDEKALEVVDEELKPDVPEVPDVPDEGAEETKETEAVEIVLDDDKGSQPANRGIRTRINKLNAKVKTAENDQSATAQALVAEQQKNELLKLALDQQGSSKAPNPNDFEDGAADAKFVEASDAHIQSLVTKGVEKAVSALPRSAPTDTGLIRKQEQHLDRADKLGVTDFDVVQDAAISVLGHAMVNEIISKSDRSERILYYLGSDPKNAEAFKDLVASDPIQAAMEIGRLGERLKVKPLAKTQQAEPDEELEGGSADTSTAYERQLDKLRTAATEGGDMKALMEFKKKHREKAA